MQRYNQERSGNRTNQEAQPNRRENLDRSVGRRPWRLRFRTLLWETMLEDFLHQRCNHPGRVGGMHTDSVRFTQSIILNAEGEAHTTYE